LVSLSASLC